MTNDTPDKPKAESEDESVTTHSDNRNFSSLTLLLGGFLLMVFYVLSVGPVAAIIDSPHSPDWIVKVIIIVYYPLGWLYDNSEVCRAFLEQYIEWWSDLF